MVFVVPHKIRPKLSKSKALKYHENSKDWATYFLTYYDQYGNVDFLSAKGKKPITSENARFQEVDKVQEGRNSATDR